MARKPTTGLKYFPFDVDFFNDDKVELIEAEYGLKGVHIAIKLLCKIYKENGYYYQWGDDQCLLFSKKAGDGIVHGLVNEVVNRLVARSFFDKGVFDRFKILTSSGIQKRYFTALERAKNIDVIKQYLVIDTLEFKNVTLINLNVALMDDNVTLSTQTKLNETKLNETTIPQNKFAHNLDFDKLLLFYNQTFKKNSKIVNDNVRKKYIAVLKQGYEKKDIENAMRNCSKNTFHIENNYQYCTLEFFSRANILDKYREVAKIQQSENVTTNKLEKITIEN